MAHFSETETVQQEAALKFNCTAIKSPFQFVVRVDQAAVFLCPLLDHLSWIWVCKLGLSSIAAMLL